MGPRSLRTIRDGGLGDPSTRLGPVLHETDGSRADLAGSFVCMYCDTNSLTVDAVDVSSVIAIARGRLACGGCAEVIFDDDATADRTHVLRVVAPQAEQNWIAEDV